jgi:hypothetical protein
MKKSNVLTFTVTAAPPPVTITDNRISAPKTELAVNEAVTISGTLTFSAALPDAKTIKIDIYSNDSKVPGSPITITAPKGSTTASYSFTISFPSAGTYNVYTDAYFA